MVKPFFFTLLFTALMFSCSRKSVSALERKGIRVSKHDLTIQGTSTQKDTLQIQYLGCGGLILRLDGQAIMIDPYFSNQRFMKIGRSLFLGGKIRSSRKQIAAGKHRILKNLYKDDSVRMENEVRAIFSAHGHYDHLMDIPYLYQYWFNRKPVVFANTSSCNTIANVIDRDDLRNAEEFMSVRDTQGKSADFLSAGGYLLKVYPIMAAHNPHARNIKLFSGSVMKPPAHFSHPEAKTMAEDWLEGRTMSFLIDVEKNDRIVFRMFVQSSSCHYPDGLPPSDLLAKRPVDIALMGIASYKFSGSSYPCQYLDSLRPGKVVFIHWEDFFRKYQKPVRSLQLNDIPGFFDTIFPACQKTDYILPVPGVVMNVAF